jgi:hypothetical protein
MKRHPDNDRIPCVHELIFDAQSWPEGAIR